MVNELRLRVIKVVPSAEPQHLAVGQREPAPTDAEIAYVRPFVEKASLALCVNQAWAMLAAFAIVGLLIAPFARDPKP